MVQPLRLGNCGESLGTDQTKKSLIKTSSVLFFCFSMNLHFGGPK